MINALNFQALLLAAALAVAPATGQVLADATPGDRAAVAEASAALMDGATDLARLDALLKRLPEPTVLRGRVQARRADLLLDADRMADGRAAAEEAARLAPKDAGVLIAAAYTLTFAGAPQRAADLWFEASLIDPDLARQSDRYFLKAMLTHLRDRNDLARVDKIEVRMDEIGIVAALAPERSSSALARLKTTFDRLGIDAARPLIAAVTAPQDLLSLYMDRQYAPLWPAIEQWAGRDFEPMHRRYLEEVRREWWTERSMTAATNYGRVLNSIGRYDDTIKLFLPLVSADLSREDIDDRIFLTPVVAGALRRAGRAAEASALLAKVKAGMPDNNEGLALNLSAVDVTQAYENENWPDVIRLADGWLATARKLGPEINISAIQLIGGYRACALAQTGRAEAAAAALMDTAMAQKRNPSVLFEFYTCSGDRERARALLLEALAGPLSRRWALGIVQPSALRPGASKRARTSLASIDDLRRDATVREAVEKVGRQLPRPLLESMPAGFDPLQDGPQSRPAADSI